MGLSPSKNPDCRRLEGDGEGGICDRVSTVRSVRDGRGRREVGESSSSLGRVPSAKVDVLLGGGDIKPPTDSASSCFAAMLDVRKPGCISMLRLFVCGGENGPAVLEAEVGAGLALALLT